MTITFPRTLPNNARMTECWFDIIDDVGFAPSGRGTKLNLTQVNDPVWKGTFVTPILERDVRPIWSAWRKTLRGGLKTFIAYDVRNATPFAYPTAKVPTDVGGGWSGLATVTAIGASSISLSALPSTYQAKVGDRIGLEQSGFYGYYEIVEDVTASGGVATVNVVPFIHTGIFTTSAVCRVWRPNCQFMIDPSSYSEMGTVENTPISFAGFQRL